MEKDVTLDDFISEQITSIYEFKLEWENGVKNNPDAYPQDLEAGEWDEQLRAFQHG